uniref:Uncharacterized protein n=1 Tax=Syphacia muris TaxID=451379 RepID=A0A0N5AYA9_9BILA
MTTTDNRSDSLTTLAPNNLFEQTTPESTEEQEHLHETSYRQSGPEEQDLTQETQATESEFPLQVTSPPEQPNQLNLPNLSQSTTSAPTNSSQQVLLANLQHLLQERVPATVIQSLANLLSTETKTTNDDNASNTTRISSAALSSELIQQSSSTRTNNQGYLCIGLCMPYCDSQCIAKETIRQLLLQQLSLNQSTSSYQGSALNTNSSENDVLLTSATVSPYYPSEVNITSPQEPDSYEVFLPNNENTTELDEHFSQSLDTRDEQQLSNITSVNGTNCPLVCMPECTPQCIAIVNQIIGSTTETSITAVTTTTLQQSAAPSTLTPLTDDDLTTTATTNTPDQANDTNPAGNGAQQSSICIPVCMPFCTVECVTRYFQNLYPFLPPLNQQNEQLLRQLLLSTSTNIQNVATSSESNNPEHSSSVPFLSSLQNIGALQNPFMQLSATTANPATSTSVSIKPTIGNEHITVNLPLSFLLNPNCRTLCHNSCLGQCAKQSHNITVCNKSCSSSCMKNCAAQLLNRDQSVLSNIQRPNLSLLSLSQLSDAGNKTPQYTNCLTTISSMKCYCPVGFAVCGNPQRCCKIR